jgi:hypothetical protein
MQRRTISVLAMTLPYLTHGQTEKREVDLLSDIQLITGIRLSGDNRDRMKYGGIVTIRIGDTTIEKYVEALRYTPNEALGYFFDLKPCSKSGCGFEPNNYKIEVEYTDRRNATFADSPFGTGYNVDVYLETLQT